MSALTWDQVGDRFYETGIDKGVLYIPNESGVYDNGVAWSGLTSISEEPTGAAATPKYADNIKYLNLISTEQFDATLTAFTYPDEFGQFDGLVTPTPGVTVGQQGRKSFGLAYRTKVGNDIDGIDHGYKVHLVYGLTAAPSVKGYTTINDQPNAIDFSWKLSSIPVNATGLKPTSLITINSNDVSAGALAALEVILYGTDGVDPRLPLPDEVISIMEGSALATNVVVAGAAGAVNITGTTANYLFTIEHWDVDDYDAVMGGTLVNEAAAEALTLAAGTTRVTLHAADDHYIPAAQQEVFVVIVT